MHSMRVTASASDPVQGFANPVAATSESDQYCRRVTTPWASIETISPGLSFSTPRKIENGVGT